LALASIPKQRRRPKTIPNFAYGTTKEIYYDMFPSCYPYPLKRYEISESHSENSWRIPYRLFETLPIAYLIKNRRFGTAVEQINREFGPLTDSRDYHWRASEFIDPDLEILRMKLLENVISLISTICYETYPIQKNGKSTNQRGLMEQLKSLTIYLNRP